MKKRGLLVGLIGFVFVMGFIFVTNSALISKLSPAAQPSLPTSDVVVTIYPTPALAPAATGIPNWTPTPQKIEPVGTAVRPTVAPMFSEAELKAQMRKTTKISFLVNQQIATPVPSSVGRGGPNNIPLSIYTLDISKSNKPLSLQEINASAISKLDFYGSEFSGMGFYYSKDGTKGVIEDWGLHLVNLKAQKLESLYLSGRGSFFLGWHPDQQNILIRAFDGGALALEDESKDVILKQVQFGEYLGAAISPDGKRLIYAMRGRDTSSLWLANSDGSNSQMVETDNRMGYYGMFQWSPDGRYIAYMGHGGLVIAEANGNDLFTRLVGTDFVPAFGFGQGKFEWSPDGKYLVVVVQSQPDTDTPSEFRFTGADILILDVATGKTRRLVEGPLGNIDPAWSPDGKQVLFVSNRSGSAQIWLVNADGTGLRQLTNSKQPVRWPFWN